MRILKLFLLIFTIILADNNILLLKTSFISQAYAKSSPTFNSDRHVAADKASNPKCLMSKYIMAAFGVLLGVAILNLASPFAPISMGALVMFITQNIIYFACAYAFVKNPVLRFTDGAYKTCTNPKNTDLSNDGKTNDVVEICPDKQFSKEDAYQWPKNRAPYSDYIEFCHRNPMGGAICSTESCRGIDPREKESSPDDLLRNKISIGGELECKTLKIFQTTTIHGVKYKAYRNGDKVCVNAYGLGNAAWWPQPEIGCHLRSPDPPAPMCEKSKAVVVDSVIVSYDNSECFKCYISNSCYGTAGIYSHAPMVMTSVVIQCLKETLSNLVEGCSGTANVGFLEVAKKALKNTALAVLVLAIMLFGVKVAIGAVNEGKDWLFFLIKIIVVYYFAIGGGVNDYYDKIVAISNGLSTVVFQAGGNQTVCDYKSSEYMYPVRKIDQTFSKDELNVYKSIIKANTYHDFDSISNAQNNISDASALSGDDYNSFVSKLEFQNFYYLLLWDQLDCRMGFYLGQSVFSAGGGIGVASLILWPIGLLFAGQILFAICVAFLVFMLILVVIWVVHLFILSLVLMTIIIVFAPLFIPMILFSATKGFFDGWLRELIAYSLYPIILFAFLGLLFSVFDNLYFGDLTFKRVQDTNMRSVRAIYNFTLADDKACDKKFTNLACIVSKSNFITKPLIFGINVTSPSVWGDTGTIWENFALLGLMAFLFYHFLGILGALAAELAGSFRADLSRSVSSPLDMLKKVASVGKGAIDKVKEKSSNKTEDKKEDSKDSGKKREDVKGGS